MDCTLEVSYSMKYSLKNQNTHNPWYVPAKNLAIFDSSPEELRKTNL